jgi:hypothetical protein
MAYLRATFHISGSSGSPVTALKSKGEESVSDGFHAVVVL